MPDETDAQNLLQQPTSDFALYTMLWMRRACWATVLGGPVAMAGGLIAYGLLTSSLEESLTKNHDLREVPQEANLTVARLVAEEAQARGMKPPRVRIAPAEWCNAFSVRLFSKRGTITISDELLKGLNEVEVRAVVRHELSHIRHRDSLRGLVFSVGGMATAWARRALIIGAIMTTGGALAVGGAFVAAVLGPVMAASIVAGAAFVVAGTTIRRHAEMRCDVESAHSGQNPLALASALRSMEAHEARLSQLESHEIGGANGPEAEGESTPEREPSKVQKLLVRVLRDHPGTPARIGKAEEIAGESLTDRVGGNIPYAAVDPRTHALLLGDEVVDALAAGSPGAQLVHRAAQLARRIMFPSQRPHLSHRVPQARRGNETRQATLRLGLPPVAPSTRTTEHTL